MAHCTTADPDAETLRPELDEVFSGHAGKQSDLIPVLQSVQKRFGYVPPASIGEIARFLGIAESRAYAVITFYQEFRLVPLGRNRVRICQGTACHVRGAKDVVDAVSRAHGIGPGETSEDGRISLESVACLGTCALAPVVTLNDAYHGAMTPKKTIELLEGCE